VFTTPAACRFDPKAQSICCRFSVRHSVQLRTSTKDNDANPTWNESFKLLVHDVEAQVHFILPPPPTPLYPTPPYSPHPSCSRRQ